MARSRILDLLTGTDRRSIGRSPLVVRRVLRSPALLPSLVRGLTVADPIVRMRAADALEKISHTRPELLQRFRARFLRLAATTDQPELQWHLAQLLPRLTLRPAEHAAATRAFRAYLGSPSAIVQAMALEALVRLAPATEAGRARALALLEEADHSAFAAVRARARRLRSALEARSRRRARRGPGSPRGAP
jgi:hypothetical protein